MSPREKKIPCAEISANLAMRGPGLGGDLRRGSKSPEQNMITTRGCSGDSLAEQVRLVALSWGAAGGTGHHPLPAPQCCSGQWQGKPGSECRALTKTDPSHYLIPLDMVDPYSVLAGPQGSARHQFLTGWGGAGSSPHPVHLHMASDPQSHSSAT